MTSLHFPNYLRSVPCGALALQSRNPVQLLMYFAGDLDLALTIATLVSCLYLLFSLFLDSSTIPAS